MPIKDAMVLAREVQEVLHRLHWDQHVDLFDINMTKTRNTGTAIFFGDVIPSCLSTAVINNFCTALLNLHLRRQHKVEVSKDWMGRAKISGTKTKANPKRTSMLSRKRSATIIVLSWQCQRCSYTNDCIKNKKHCCSCWA